MNRKQFKAIQNIAAKQGGRAMAKVFFDRRKDFTRVDGAFIHRPSATLFVL